jgi:hypothetical protein
MHGSYRVAHTLVELARSRERAGMADTQERTNTVRNTAVYA